MRSTDGALAATFTTAAPPPSSPLSRSNQPRAAAADPDAVRATASASATGRLTRPAAAWSGARSSTTTAAGVPAREQERSSPRPEGLDAVPDGRYGNFSYSFPVPNGTYTVTSQVCRAQPQRAGPRLRQLDCRGPAAAVRELRACSSRTASFYAVDKQFVTQVADGALDICTSTLQRRNRRSRRLERCDDLGCAGPPPTAPPGAPTATPTVPSATPQPTRTPTPTIRACPPRGPAPALGEARAWSRHGT